VLASRQAVPSPSSVSPPPRADGSPISQPQEGVQDAHRRARVTVSGEVLTDPVEFRSVLANGLTGDVAGSDARGDALGTWMRRA